MSFAKAVLLVFMGAIFLAENITAVNMKRILLPEQDKINAKLLNLEQRLNELKTENHNIKFTLGQRIQNLETENNYIKQLLNSVSTSNSATFVRWGRKDCPNLNGTVLVYTGITGGGPHNGGGASNMLCLPHDPDFLTVVPSRLEHSKMFARVYGTEYQFSYKNVAIEDDVPCAVCQVTTAASSLMIPAKSSCPTGWHAQYDGMLVGDYSGYSTSEFVCLDGNPQYFEGRRGNTNGNLFYPAVGVCGTLPCPSYADNKYLSCVLCTK